MIVILNKIEVITAYGKLLYEAINKEVAMKKIVDRYTNNIFENIKHTDEYGNEYWYARELSKVLEYKDWRNFLKVLNKAKDACKNSGFNIDEQLVEVNRLSKRNNNATANIQDYKLSRYICYLIVQITNLPILTKNLLTFCCTAPLLPISFLISKILKIQFQDKSNSLNKLGILFSVNQMIYLLIAMWIYPTMPDKMLMVIAMIFGAHLLPYSWLYNSKTYMVLSIIIPILSLIIGLNFANYILATMMIVIEIIFSILLAFENKKIKND